MDNETKQAAEVAERDVEAMIWQMINSLAGYDDRREFVD